MDIVFATVFLAIGCPLFPVIALAIKLDSKGPVLFRQARVGRSGRPFQILKFRSMLSNAAHPMRLITAASDPRITPVGRLLRNTKLDELPQMWNVIRGDMSLVGPRPEIEKHVSEGYSEQDKGIVFAVRPGLTDPASIRYYSEERLLRGQADVEGFYLAVVLPRKIRAYRLYVQTLSFKRDVQIIGATLRAVAFSVTQQFGRAARRR